MNSKGMRNITKAMSETEELTPVQPLLSHLPIEPLANLSQNDSQQDSLQHEINTYLRQNGFRPLDISSYSVSSVLLDVLRSYERRGKVLELSRKQMQEVKERMTHQEGSTPVRKDEPTETTRNKEGLEKADETDNASPSPVASLDEAVPSTVSNMSATPEEATTNPHYDSTQDPDIAILKEKISRLEEKIDQMNVHSDLQEQENDELRERIESLLLKMNESKHKAHLQLRNIAAAENPAQSGESLDTSASTIHDEELHEGLSSFILSHDDEKEILEEDIKHYKDEIRYLNSEMKKLASRSTENEQIQLYIHEIQMLKMQLQIFRDKEEKYQQKIREIREQFEAGGRQSQGGQSASYVEALENELNEMKDRLNSSSRDSRDTGKAHGMHEDTESQQLLAMLRATSPQDAVSKLHRLLTAIQALPKLQRFVVEVCDALSDGKRVLKEGDSRVPPSEAVDQINAWIYMLAQTREQESDQKTENG